jgi:hypothetical protein
MNQVCERWIYSSCLCFALDFEEHDRTSFNYAHSIYQVEYSSQPAVRVRLPAVAGELMLTQQRSLHSAGSSNIWTRTISVD